MKIKNIILDVLDNFKVVILILIRECRQDLTKKKRKILNWKNENIYVYKKLKNKIKKYIQCYGK